METRLQQVSANVVDGCHAARSWRQDRRARRTLIL